MTLPAEITAALIALALTVLGGLGTLATLLVRYWQRRIEILTTKLDANTALTEAVHAQTNGNLAAARDEAAKYRVIAERLTWIVREVNATPDGRALLDQVMARHRVIVHDSDFDSLLTRLMHQPARGSSRDST